MKQSSLYGQSQQNQWSARRAATASLAAVISGRSLNQVLPKHELQVDEQDRAFYRDLILGSCRYYQRLNAIAKILLKQAFGDEDQDLHALLVIGLYQLVVQQKAPHAAVHATVDCADELGKGYAKSVINACLRRYGREYESILPALDDNPVTATSHPKWLVKMLRAAWPDQWQAILQENNQLPPLCLRVNRRFSSRDAYLARLTAAGFGAERAAYSDDGIYWLEPGDVTQLPGFDLGHVSVQDEAAQLAAQLINPQANERMLDACAAPGGKSAHLLERGDIQLTALDIDPQRAERISENLSRLELSADIVCGDIQQADAWWDGQGYDAILLDVPCSATGVIRRHPDIKLLRQRQDIAALQQTQADILAQAWLMLKPGGRLLYATCSVLPAENEHQVAAFLANQDDAKVEPMVTAWGTAVSVGRQLFPQTKGHDGFYYALLTKDID